MAIVKKLNLGKPKNDDKYFDVVTNTKVIPKSLFSVTNNTNNTTVTSEKTLFFNILTKHLFDFYFYVNINELVV